MKSHGEQITQSGVVAKRTMPRRSPGWAACIIKERTPAIVKVTINKSDIFQPYCRWFLRSVDGGKPPTYETKAASPPFVTRTWLTGDRASVITLGDMAGRSQP